MPYVEVWVDELELDAEQLKAIGDLVVTARDIAQRRWPDHDAIQLERASTAVIRKLPALGRNKSALPLFQADRKYQQWQNERGARGVAASVEAQP